MHWTFFAPGCYENLTVTWDFKNQRKCENLHQDVLNETIDYKWTTTLTLDTWTYTVKQKLFSPNKMDFLDFFIHSFLFHDIGWGKNWTFSCSCLLQFFEYLSRVTENLAKFACNRHDFLMGSTKCGVITTTTRLPEKIHIKQLTLKISFKDLQMSSWP